MSLTIVNHPGCSSYGVLDALASLDDRPRAA